MEQQKVCDPPQWGQVPPVCEVCPQELLCCRHVDSSAGPEGVFYLQVCALSVCVVGGGGVYYLYIVYSVSNSIKLSQTILFFIQNQSWARILPHCILHVSNVVEKCQ